MRLQKSFLTKGKEKKSSLFVLPFEVVVVVDVQVERALARSLSSLKEKEKVTRRSFIKYDLRARIDKEGTEAKADLGSGFLPFPSALLRRLFRRRWKISVASFIFFSTSVNSFEQTNLLASHSSLLLAGFQQQGKRNNTNQIDCTADFKFPFRLKPIFRCNHQYMETDE